MNRGLRIAALIVVGAGMAAFVTSAHAYNWNSKSSFDTEWQTQMNRISAGRKSGVLSRAEARRLRRNLNAIAAMPYNSRAREMLSRESKEIAAAKQP
jgi:hypothetical protein